MPQWFWRCVYLRVNTKTLLGSHIKYAGVFFTLCVFVAAELRIIFYSARFTPMSLIFIFFELLTLKAVTCRHISYRVLIVCLATIFIAKHLALFYTLIPMITYRPLSEFALCR